MDKDEMAYIIIIIITITIIISKSAPKFLAVNRCVAKCC